jgi:ketosteroid isomerase-like protein
MSSDNVDTLKRAREAWDADNLNTFLAEADPEVEWHTAIGEALQGKGGTYRGHDGVREAWDEYRVTAWGGFTSEAEEIRDLGDSVLLLGHLDVSARTSGIDLGQEFGQLITFRDGKILRAQDFLSHADALRAVGLSE